MPVNILQAPNRGKVWTLADQLVLARGLSQQGLLPNLCFATGRTPLGVSMATQELIWQMDHAIPRAESGLMTAEQRWQEGLRWARENPVVLRALISHIEDGVKRDPEAQANFVPEDFFDAGMGQDKYF